MRALNRGLADLHLPRRAEGDGPGPLFTGDPTEVILGLQARIHELERTLCQLRGPCAACGSSSAPAVPIEEATLCDSCNILQNHRHGETPR